MFWALSYFAFFHARSMLPVFFFVFVLFLIVECGIFYFFYLIILLLFKHWHLQPPLRDVPPSR